MISYKANPTPKDITGPEWPRHPWTRCTQVPHARKMLFGRWPNLFRCPICNNVQQRVAARAECNGYTIRKVKT